MASLVVFNVLLAFLPLFAASAPTASPVGITLYYESLCPGCRAFIANQLYPTYTKVKDIMDVTLVPYGNAQESWDGQQWRFSCQHGEAECVGNLIEVCAISHLANVSTYFPFIHCFETYISSSNPRSAAEYCAKLARIDYAVIDKCASGAEGNKLEHEMAARTNALEPPHQYVPWVTMNGKHTNEIQNEATENLLKLVCDNYMGTKPSACNPYEHTQHERCMKTA